MTTCTTCTTPCPVRGTRRSESDACHRWQAWIFGAPLPPLRQPDYPVAEVAALYKIGRRAQARAVRTLHERINARVGFVHPFQWVNARSWHGCCQEIIEAILGSSDHEVVRYTCPVTGTPACVIYRQGQHVPHFVSAGRGKFFSTIWTVGDTH